MIDIAPQQQRRILRAAASMPARDARRVLGVTFGLPAMVCGARTGPGSRLAARHWRLREPKIKRLERRLDEFLTNWKHRLLWELHRMNPSVIRAAEWHPGEELPPLPEPADAIVAAGGIIGDFMFSVAEFARGLIATIREEATAIFIEAGREWMIENGMENDTRATPRKVFEFFEKRENLLTTTAEDIHKEVMATISEGVKNGEPMADLSRRITSVMDNISTGRANTIASTETGAAYGAARHEALINSGLEFKSWFTTHDNSRAWHIEAGENEENQRIPADKRFVVRNGDGVEEFLMHPGDPVGSPDNVINCHCIEIAVSANEGRKL